MLAEIDELELGEACSCCGNEDLASVAGRRDARGAMDVVADVALLGEQRRPGVEPGTHADRARGKRLRHGRGGREGARRRREREEERVALRIDLDSAAGHARLAYRPAVLGQSVGVGICAELMEQLRRPLHVGEEEGDRAGREIRAHSGMMVRRLAGSPGGWQQRPGRRDAHGVPPEVGT